MGKSFESVSLNGIIKPGEVYVFTDSEIGLEEISGTVIIYTIRSDEELVAALEMEMNLALPADDYDITGFIGWERISEDCFQFRFSCNPNEGYDGEDFSIYLHRVIQFSERLELLKQYLEEISEEKSNGD